MRLRYLHLLNFPPLYDLEIIFGYEPLLDRPLAIRFIVGVNGTGKTTAIAKIVNRLHSLKISCVLAAADTFRAGAIEQLQRHADTLGVRLIKHRAGADPAVAEAARIRWRGQTGAACRRLSPLGTLDMDSLRSSLYSPIPPLFVLVSLLAGCEGVPYVLHVAEGQLGIQGNVEPIDADLPGPRQRRPTDRLGTGRECTNPSGIPGLLGGVAHLLDRSRGLRGRDRRHRSLAQRPLLTSGVRPGFWAF